VNSTRAFWAPAVALGTQATFAGLTVFGPGWSLVDLDQEHNLPTWFHSGLLALAALLALDVGRRESRLLALGGRSRSWALAWLPVATLFAYLALDESLVIHEGFFTREVTAWLGPASPWTLTLAWLLVFTPGIVGMVVFLLASLGARVRLSPRLTRWGALGLAAWVAALGLEGTAKTVFIPRNLYLLEVVLEESAEVLGTVLFAWAFWCYRGELAAWLAAPGPRPPLRLAVPWRWVFAGTLGLLIPAGTVAGSIALNPYLLDKLVGDEHLRAGRLEAASSTYRRALARAPEYARAWHRLGVAELRRGELEAARDAFATALRLEPRHAATANNLGVVYFRQGRFREAAEAFRRATALSPEDPDTHRNLGVALRRLGRQPDAEAALARARALRPEPVAVRHLRVRVPISLPLGYEAHPGVEVGLAETLAGRSAAALDTYRSVLRHAPDLRAAHLALANELVRAAVGRRLSGRLGPVRVSGAEDAEPAWPVPTASHFIYRPDQGWRAVEAPLEPAPGGPEPSRWLDQAERHYRRAVELGAGGAAYLGLACLEAERGRPDAAAAHLAVARRLDPGLPSLASPPSAGLVR
jgi:Flp pilus assembly protein TadD